jgi:hypothetical protein
MRSNPLMSHKTPNRLEIEGLDYHHQQVHRCVCIFFFGGGIDPVTGGFPVIYTFNSPLNSFDYISVFTKGIS